MPGPYISKIEFKNGEYLDFLANDVVIFVGSNNCGKSTTLKEIDSLYKNNNAGTGNKLIEKIYITNELNNEDFKNQILSKSQENIQRGKSHYQGINYNIPGDQLDNMEHRRKNSSNYYNIFSTILNTNNRLELVKPKERKKTGHDAPSEVYHIYGDDSMKFQKLKILFEKVFGPKLRFYPGFHDLTLDFKVSPNILTDCLYGDTNFGIKKQEYLASDSIDLQGDGMKSFTGIVAELISGDKNTYYIDEPESFLHPPQSNILGQEIGTLTEGQIFLATHSQDFIKGVLKSNSNRVKIIRINRAGDTTNFILIDPKDLISIQTDPFLHYSNYLDSLFNHYTIICEDATDCIFYNRIFDIILKEENKENISVNYVYTGGKNSFAKVYQLSQKIGIRFGFIGDIDLLNNRLILEQIIGKAILKSYKKNRTKLKHKVNAFGIVEKTGADIKEEINLLINDTDVITKADKSKLLKVFNKLKKPRDVFKTQGVRIYCSRVPDYYKDLVDFLENKGIFLVPLGEMENFINSIPHEKKNFVNEALKIDQNSHKLNKVKIFIRKIVGII